MVRYQLAARDVHAARQEEPPGRNAAAAATPGTVPSSPPGKDGWVFPFAEPRPAINAVRKASGQTFCLHDLRRTFASIANGLDINYYSVKALLNHAASGDVTAGYDVPDMARLKKASARIEGEILRLAGELTADVVVLRA